VQGWNWGRSLEFSDSVDFALEPSLIFVRGTLGEFGISLLLIIENNPLSGKAISAFSNFKMRCSGSGIFVIRPEGLLF